ncbi:MAG: glycosyltransferase, partial [Pseudomonadota bacterium]
MADGSVRLADDAAGETAALDGGQRERIAFVALEFYPATPGGTGILLHHTIASLLARGYPVALLVDMERAAFEKIRDEVRLDLPNGSDLEVWLVDDLVPEAALAQVAFASPEQRRSARIALALEALQRDVPLSMVEFYDYCGPAFYALAGDDSATPPAIAVRLHNTVELIQRRVRSPFDLGRSLDAEMERRSIAGADLLLSPGPAYLRDEIMPLYPEVDAERVALSPPIHRPVGQVRYDPMARDVVFYGRLSRFKGLDTFLRGASLALRDAGFERWLGRFLIIGPEETVAGELTRADCEALILPEQRERFEFTGRMEHAALFDRLGTAAFACFANRIESFCYAAHELATAGMPLVLSDTPA